MKYTPGERVTLQNIQIVERFERHIELITQEKDGHKADCKTYLAKIDKLKDELHAEKIKVVELQTVTRGDRWKDAVCAVLGIIGACLISSFHAGDWEFSLGWCLVIIAAIYQIGRAAFKTP